MFNVKTNFIEILLKYKSWFSRSKVGPQVMYFGNGLSRGCGESPFYELIKGRKVGTAGGEIYTRNQPLPPACLPVPAHPQQSHSWQPWRVLASFIAPTDNTTPVRPKASFWELFQALHSSGRADPPDQRPRPRDWLPWSCDPSKNWLSKEDSLYSPTVLPRTRPVSRPNCLVFHLPNYF